MGKTVSKVVKYATKAEQTHN